MCESFFLLSYRCSMVHGTTREYIAGLISKFASEHILMSLEEILECVEGSKTDVSAFRSLKTWLSNSGGEPRGTSRLSKGQRQGILLAPKRVRSRSRGSTNNGRVHNPKSVRDTGLARNSNVEPCARPCDLRIQQ